MKSIDVKTSTYVAFDVKNNDKDRKFKFGSHVRISKYKNNFAKGYTPNLSEEIFVIKKVKNTVHSRYMGSTEHMLLVILLEIFMKNNCKKQIKQS